MTILPLGWTSNSYRIPVSRQGRSGERASAKAARRGTAAMRRHRVAGRARRDIVLPMGWAGSAYGRGPQRF